MLNLEDLMTRGTYASATETTGPTLTASSLLKQMQRVMAGIARGSASGPLVVRESPLALQTVPVKQHKKRRNQTAYHRRVQKKWTKRYGTKQVPAAYVLDNRQIGGHGQTLVAHPSIVASLKMMVWVLWQAPNARANLTDTAR